MVTFFVLGGLWFWLLLAVSVISITALVENEHNALADLVFIASMVALYKLGCQQPIIDIGNWIVNHVLYSILIFIGYFVAGTAYCVAKWYVYLIDARDKIIRNNDRFYADKFTPGRNKARILHWAIYWPINGAWTLISNPVVKLFNRIFYKLEGFLQSMSDKIMKPVSEKSQIKNN
jgi:hypothetical protein